nr:hypothetical protein Q903MT_gene3620 [Picea sitchensis]
MGSAWALPLRGLSVLCHKKKNRMDYGGMASPSFHNLHRSIITSTDRYSYRRVNEGPKYSFRYRGFEVLKYSSFVRSVPSFAETIAMIEPLET